MKIRLNSFRLARPWRVRLQRRAISPAGRAVTEPTARRKRSLPCEVAAAALLWPLFQALLIASLAVPTAQAAEARTDAAHETHFLLAAAQDAPRPTPEANSTDRPPAEQAEAEDESEAQTSTQGTEARTSRRQRSERVAVGRKIRVRKDETASEVVVVLGSATVEGTVEGSVVVVGGEAFIDAKVGGELISVWSAVELGPNAQVQGEAVAVGKPLKLDPAAKLAVSPIEVPLGDLGIGFESFKRNILEGVLLRPLPPHVKWAWFLGACFFILHLAVAVVLGQPVQACARTLADKPVRSLFVGLLIAILSPLLLVLLSPTLIGPPLLVGTLMVASLLGKVAVYTASGGQIGRQLRLSLLETPLIAFLLGTMLFYLLYMVPVLGWLVWLVITPLGAGAAVLAAVTALSREGRTSPRTAVLAPVAAPTVALATPGTASPAMLVKSVHVSETSAVEAGAAISGATSVPLTVKEVAAPPIGSGLQLPPVLPLAPRTGLAPAELAALERAGFWPRFAAALLDFMPLAIVSTLFGGFPAFILLAVAYHAGMWVWRGATLGGVVLGLKVVRLDGRDMDWPTALVRSLGSFVSLLAFGLGFFWASWSEERQSWHDIIAGTTIAKLRKREALV